MGYSTLLETSGNGVPIGILPITIKIAPLITLMGQKVQRYVLCAVVRGEMKVSSENVFRGIGMAQNIGITM